MQVKLWIAGIVGALALSTTASAVTSCPQNTWCFSGNPGTQSNGYSQVITLGGINNNTVAGTISVFAEQINDTTQNIVGSIYNSPINGQSTLNGLFQVNGSDGNGIAPYNPAEGSASSYQNQQGIAEGVGADPSNDLTNTSSNLDNILEIELGSNIAQGTTLKFLLQAGPNAGSPSVNWFFADASTPQSPSAMTPGATNNPTTIAITDSGTTSQFSVTKNTSGIEFVAIEADCHYLLLDTITGVPTSTPEPRFYGMLLAGFLGIAGMFYQRRRAQANA